MEQGLGLGLGLVLGLFKYGKKFVPFLILKKFFF